jgi:hypothetical protein
MRFVNALVIVFAVAASVTAQSVDAEMAMLRELLKVPDSTEIVPSTSALPLTSPIQVFIVVGTDPKTQKAFAKRFAEWNRKDGLKYGMVEQVANLSDAEVVLVRHDIRLNGPPPSYSLPLVPIRSYSYLIVHGPDRLQILWRTVFEGYSDVTDTESFGGAVRREFFKRMKARPKR